MAYWGYTVSGKLGKSIISITQHTLKLSLANWMKLLIYPFA